MNLKSFFNLLALSMFAGGDKRPSRSMVETQRKELMKRKDLQAEAKRIGDDRRLNAWKRSCEGGYAVKLDKGQPGGIPRWWLKQRSQRSQAAI